MRKRTIGAFLDEVCQSYSNNEAIYDVLQKRSYTYTEFSVMVNTISKGLLEKKIKSGDHIGILADNGVQWAAVFCAICKIGAVAVLLNTGNSKEELTYSINFTGIKMLFTTENDLKKIDQENICTKCVYFINNTEALRDDLSSLMVLASDISDKQLEYMEENVNQNDVATIQFTSGTTGNAKAVMTSHYSIWKTAKEVADEFQYNAKDKLLLGAPLYHILGYISTFVTALLKGASLTLVSKFKTDVVLRTIEQHRCTSFHGVPTMYQYLADCCERYDISSLKKGMIAGADCTKELRTDCFYKLKLEKLIDYYGQTEGMNIGFMVLTKDNYDAPIALTKMADIDLKVAPREENSEENNETGQLMIRTKCRMKGYYHNEEATKKALQGKWLYTGDLALFHEDGTFELKGRLGDLVNRGGENIVIGEVEKRFLRNQAIEKAVVMGVPDKIYGQEIAAFIQTAPGHLITMQELKDYVIKSFEKMERPKYLKIVKDFPRTSTGKIKKYKLVELLNLNC